MRPSPPPTAAVRGSPWAIRVGPLLRRSYAPTVATPLLSASQTGRLPPRPLQDITVRVAKAPTVAHTSGTRGIRRSLICCSRRAMSASTPARGARHHLRAGDAQRPRPARTAPAASRSASPGAPRRRFVRKSPLLWLSHSRTSPCESSVPSRNHASPLRGHQKRSQRRR